MGVVVIEEPSVTETVEILWGLREVYENYHDLIISDEALTAAVKFSEQYVQDRFLPDKTCAKVRLGDFTFDLVEEPQNKESFSDSQQLFSKQQVFFRDIYNCDVNQNSLLENDEVYPNIVDFLESKLTEI